MIEYCDVLFLPAIRIGVLAAITMTILDLYQFSIFFDGIKWKLYKWRDTCSVARYVYYLSRCPYCLSHWIAIGLLLILYYNRIFGFDSFSVAEGVFIILLSARLTMMLRNNIYPPIIATAEDDDYANETQTEEDAAGNASGINDGNNTG